MYLILLLSFFFSASNPSALPLGSFEPAEIVIPITPVKSIVSSHNIIKVKLDTVMDDSLRLSVIESFKGDLRPNTSITVPKRLITGRLYPPTIITLENEFDTLGSIPIPRRRIVNYGPVETFIDTFVIIGASIAYSGYDVGHVYALSGQKTYANTPHDREYGGAYKRLKHLGDSEMLQQMIKVVVEHIDSDSLDVNTASADYKQFIDEFLNKFKPDNPVNSSLHHNGLEDLLLFDLNKVFGELPLKDKIEVSAYSEQLIREEFPLAPMHYFFGIGDMSISSTEDLEDAVKLFPNLVPKTRTFRYVKQLIAYAILNNKKLEARKKTIRKFMRAMSKAGDNDGGDDDFFREKLNAVLIR